MAEEPLLRVEDLRTYIQLRDGVVKAVDGVSFTVGTGESVGLVGESGSGKTMTCLSIMRLMPVPSARIVGGDVWFEGRNLATESESSMQHIRGRRMAMVMQDPLAALDPVLSVGDQVDEPLRYHTPMPKSARRNRVLEVLKAVRIPKPEERLGNYPHQFSGGMRQRIVAAMGLTTSPALVIADEPTTALDVTTQHQILLLLRELVEEFGISLLFVTHDFGVVAELCDDLCVIYAGQTVEAGKVGAILDAPSHPYTRALLACHPDRATSFIGIPGMVPSPLSRPAGCLFAPRCRDVRPACLEAPPPQGRAQSGVEVRCVQYA